MKLIRFKTILNQGEDNSVDAWIEIPAPPNVIELWEDAYSLTTYIEETTNLFCFEQTVVEKPEPITSDSYVLPEIKEFYEILEDDAKLTAKLFELYGKEWFNPHSPVKFRGLCFGRLDDLIKAGYLISDNPKQTVESLYKII